MPEQTAASAARGRAAAKARRQAITQNGGAASTPYRQGQSATRQPARAVAPPASTQGLSGRALAQARRAALANGGSNGTAVPAASTVAPRPAPPQPVQTAAPTPSPSTPSTHSPSAAQPSSLAGLSGRELARARRAAMAQGGKQGIANTPAPAPRPQAAAPVRQETPQHAPPAAATSTSTSPPAAPKVTRVEDLNQLSGRDLARARRAILARAGKKGPARALVDQGRTRAQRLRPEPKALTPTTSSAPAEAEDVQAVEDTDLDVLCQIADSTPAVLGPDTNSVRALCRQRRQAVANRGKRALPPRSSGSVSRASAKRQSVYGLTGREAAKQVRQEQCRNGRGSSPSCRPTGRVRPTPPGDAPAKVEEGTTLTGHSVTGTQVERKNRVTGNEPGTCRAVTGTEYVGVEQFASYCTTQPEPGPAKVGVSVTSSGRGLTGTEIGRSERVTGDEAGSCKPVTGTEYLGSERFEQFCATKGLLERPEKVIVGQTQRKGITVTGSDEARFTPPVTGHEAGATRPVTGTQYSDAGVARLTINGPSKVALTHTIAGRPVSGTEVGRSIKITGDEAGSCRQISGTEYLSNEQFTAVCNTRPQPAQPPKVGEDSSRQGQRITGNLVDRSERVTGNEPGSCQRVTGSQYGEAKLCGGGVDKVQRSQTLTGRPVTGSYAGHSPKLTGDEHGGCEPVTGTEYYGQEHYAEYCASTPAPTHRKVGVSQSNRGLPVSGTPMGRSAIVTGDEPGSDLAISGTPYTGREQIQRYAYVPAYLETMAPPVPPQAAAVSVPEYPAPPVYPTEQLQAAAPVAAAQPQPAVNIPAPPPPEAPAPQPVPASVYAAPAQPQALPTAAPVEPVMPAAVAPMAPPMTSPQPQMPRYQAPAGQPLPYREPVMPHYPEPEIPPRDFSIVSPARYAQEQRSRITGTAYGGSERVTGPVNMATGLVSGTPEFRYRDEMPGYAPMGQYAHAPAPAYAVPHPGLPAEAMVPPPEAVAMPPARVTGEGRDVGARITGDDWARGERITGTEGRWAQGRNPTLRGGQREMYAGARQNRELERPDVPPAKVTGSAGNYGSGPVVTVSGGARG